VRVGSDGELALHRSGAQDLASGLSPEEYLRRLRGGRGVTDSRRPTRPRGSRSPSPGAGSP
jgi:hypothetical protein